MSFTSRFFVKLVKRNSLLGQILRRVLRLFPPGLCSLSFLVEFDAIERPHYAYCIYHAADLAKRLGYDRFSVLEFGVAWGHGLAAAEKIIALVQKKFGVAIELYGFDTGAGMPPIIDRRDIPYWFEESQFHMNEVRVRARAPHADLVLGNVSETVKPFLERNIAPIGVMFIDVDIYTATRDALRVLSGRSEKYLPRLFIYLDDAVGTQYEMYGPSSGELLAISEFNAANEEKKIYRNENLQARGDCSYARQIFYGHLFDHPKYSTYIGGADQAGADSREK